jgi:signal transduction histidine kinase
VHVTRDTPVDDPLIVEVDADQLCGAIANLVRNAVEAMPGGGELFVSVARDAASDGDSILIVVQDTGPGISPQVRQHLFEPLHSTKPMGIGLGLVTARRFVEAHGGAITLRETTVGACFEIRLPIQ